MEPKELKKEITVQGKILRKKDFSFLQNRALFWSGGYANYNEYGNENIAKPW